MVFVLLKIDKACDNQLAMHLYTMEATLFGVKCVGM